MTYTVDTSEIAKFEAMAAEWWDPNGKFKPLHMMNPVRLDYITAQIAAEFGRPLRQDKPFAGRTVGSTLPPAERRFFDHPRAISHLKDIPGR